MRRDTIIEIAEPKEVSGDTQRPVQRLRRPGFFARRRTGKPWNYLNTRTIHYQSYRERHGDDPDFIYYNAHEIVQIFPSEGFQYLFGFSGSPGLGEYGTAPGDAVYHSTVNFEFTHSSIGSDNIYSWNISGTPSSLGDLSGTKTLHLGDLNDDPQVNIVNDNVTVVLAVIGFSFPGTSYEYTRTLEPYYLNYTRTLTYHAYRAPHTGQGQWNDAGHPGVTVYGNNIQGETTFYGGDGFTNPIRGTPHPDNWTTQIQTEADALIASLEAQPHIRNVTESGISIDFEWL